MSYAIHALWVRIIQVADYESNESIVRGTNMQGKMSAMLLCEQDQADGHDGHA
jgi:hypothetical protein